MNPKPEHSSFLRRRPRLARLGLLCGALLLAFLLGELALRLLGIAYPNFYQPDPTRGWALRPGAEGRWVREGNGWVEVNKQGWRERDLSLNKAAGTLRIAVLGDSMTEALQVNHEATFPRLLEKRPTGCPRLPAGKERVEVLNFGVSGYGTAQQLLTLRHAVAPYEPDFVLLAFFPGNDVRNNSRALQKDLRRPYFVLDEAGGLELDDRFRQSRSYRFRRSLPGRLLYTFLDHSRLIQAFKEAWAAAALNAQRTERGGAGSEWGLDPEVYRSPTRAHWIEAWRITEALILEMRDEARDQGARFAVTSLTSGITVHPDPAARDAAAGALGLESFRYPGEHLADFTEAHDLPFLDLQPPMAQRAEATGAIYHGFPNTRPATGHWNEEGHAAAAELLAAWLCPLLAAPQ